MSNLSSITLSEVDIDFVRKKYGVRELGIHTSNSKSDAAQGRLRMESVGNGRYGKKHPIKNSSGEIVGAIKDGFSSVGYTYCFVYSEIAHAIVITHAYYRSNKGCISFLEPSGRFGWFDATPRFEPHNSTVLDDSWISSTEAFMLLEDGERLVVLSSPGIATFDMRSRSVTTLA